MNSNTLKEINYLSHLIEQYQKNRPSQVWHNQQTIFNRTLGTLQSGKISYPVKVPLSSSESNNEQKHVSSDAKYNTVSTKVHVNPNFKPQNPVIHINPRVRAKPMIHVNPQVMKNICDRKESPSTVETKQAETTANQNRTLTSSKVSVHVNPKLMMKLSSTAEKKPVSNTQKTLQETTVPYCSRLKFVKGGSTKSTPKSALNSSIVILSKRKLVRVKRGSKPLNTSPVGVSKFKSPLNTRFKKVKVSPTKVTKTVVANAIKQSTSTNSPVKLQYIKSNVNKYTSNKAASRTFKTTQNTTTTTTNRTINKKLEMVTIGGIVYKSSKNQLVRRSYGSKKKKVSSSKADKFIIATNGRKLHRIKTGKESRYNNANAPASTINGKPLLNTLQKPNYKTNISNRVKQRSIQILRNKMRKNNQPCLIFQRFGYCANHEKGTCPKRHDKKQVSLCKKFLQGNCLLDNCPLSHDVGPEKMPTCKYFLEGCCVRDACPYRHVKVSSSTPICIEFLQGYCAKGHECTRRHEHLCPEFEKTGKCSKGKYCTYPHKLHLTTAKDEKRVKRKRAVEKLEYTTAVEESSSSNSENRLRYYEQTETFLKDIEQKRENVLKQMKIMKHVNEKSNLQQSDVKERLDDEKIANSTDTNQIESKLNVQSETQLPRRPPIGVLPAYIPIN